MTWDFQHPNLHNSEIARHIQLLNTLSTMQSLSSRLYTRFPRVLNHNDNKAVERAAPLKYVYGFHSNSAENNIEMRSKVRIHTVQLCVFANRLASACMQYATSARGRIADVATKISAKSIRSLVP